MTAAAPEPGWYDMHDHGGGWRHIHSTAQHHSGDVRNPRADDHTGVRVFATLDEARQAERDRKAAAG